MKTWFNFLNKTAADSGVSTVDDLLGDYAEVISEKHPEMTDEQKRKKIAEYPQKLADAAAAVNAEVAPIAIDAIEKFFIDVLGPEEGKGYGDLFYGELPVEEDPVKAGKKRKPKKAYIIKSGADKVKMIGGWMDAPIRAFLRHVKGDERFPDARIKEITDQYSGLEKQLAQVLETSVSEKFGPLMIYHPMLAKSFTSLFRHEYPVRTLVDPTTGEALKEGETVKEKKEAPTVDAVFERLKNMGISRGREIEPHATKGFVTTFMDDAETSALIEANVPWKDSFVKTPEGYVIYWSNRKDAENFLKYSEPVDINGEIKRLKDKAIPDTDTGAIIAETLITPSEKPGTETYTETYGETKPVSPTVLDEEKLQEYTKSHYGITKSREVETETERAKRQKEEYLKMPGPLKSKYWKELKDAGVIPPEDQAQISGDEELKEVLTAISSLSNPPHKKKAVFDIIIGDEVLDPRYGKGSVTDTSNLSEGIIEVSFGPNVKIAHYPAERIARPCMVDSEIVEFKCPMDMSIITAEACLGDMPSSPCSFLKFIEDKPHCTYIEEMNKMHTEGTKKKTDAGAKTACDKDKSEKIKICLQELTKDSSFTEHRAWMSVEAFAPIRLHAMVVKKGTEHIGEVIDKNNDGSVLVKWAFGEQTVNWENELSVTTRKADFITLLDNPDWKTIPSQQLRNIYETASNMGRNNIGFGLQREVIVPMNDIHQYLVEQGAFQPGKVTTPDLV